MRFTRLLRSVPVVNAISVEEFNSKLIDLYKTLLRKTAAKFRRTRYAMNEADELLANLSFLYRPETDIGKEIARVRREIHEAREYQA